MIFETFGHSDLNNLKEFEPPGWGDLVPRFSHFIQHSFCQPLKLTKGGKTVGIGTSIFHEDTAWLACIIVHPDHRNKGLGHTITQKLIDDTHRQQFETIYLDATDLGYPVYKKLGFEVQTQYSHFKLLQPLPAIEGSGLVSSAGEKYREQIFQLDRDVSGEGRQMTLAEHISSSLVYQVDDRLEGFYMPTLDNGLIVAATERAGLELMRYRLRDKDFAVLPVDNKPAIAYLHQNNLHHLRNSRRMILGKHRQTQLQHLYNRISGQLG
jgi:N-acetylglutamate synthase-like GNAT family acetyltransferase